MELDMNYISSCLSELHGLNIRQTDRVVFVMEKMRAQIIEVEKTDGKNNMYLPQIGHALNESIFLLKEYNKEWSLKKKFTIKDYSSFRYQVDIVLGRVQQMLESHRLNDPSQDDTNK